MENPAAFFEVLRDGLMGPTLDESEVMGCNSILAAMNGLPIAYCAYALATAWHETAAKMQPVREAFWLSEAWREKNLRYWPWYGRGYVQLTWQENYKRADSELGLGGSMLVDPDRAMEPDIAAKIMRLGMLEGWFAGDRTGRHTLERHLPESGPATERQFVSARRIINGTDRDLQVARYANSFQNALVSGNW
jgi:putative chitinase